MKINYETIRKNVKKEMIKNGVGPREAETRAHKMVADMIREESEKIRPEHRSAYVFHKLFGRGI